MPFYTFPNIITLEKGTIRHKIAQQTLISLGSNPKTPDYETFSDNGNLDLFVLYIDMCAANSKKINKEERARLEL